MHLSSMVACLLEFCNAFVFWVLGLHFLLYLDVSFIPTHFLLLFTVCSLGGLPLASFSFSSVLDKLGLPASVSGPTPCFQTLNCDSNISVKAVQVAGISFSFKEKHDTRTKTKLKHCSSIIYAVEINFLENLST